MTIYYFAYGSNMNPARMASRGMRYRRSVAGFLEGWTLAFNKRANGREGRAYANIVEDAGGGVEGCCTSWWAPTRSPAWTRSRATRSATAAMP